MFDKLSRLLRRPGGAPAPKPGKGKPPKGRGRAAPSKPVRGALKPGPAPVKSGPPHPPAPSPALAGGGPSGAPASPPSYARPPAKGMSLDRKLDIIGIVLSFVGLVSLISLFTANQSAVLKAWLGLLTSLAGWGVFGLPLGFMTVGLWLILRKFGDQLPRVDPERLAGVVLLYLALLASLHLAAPVATPPNYPEVFEFAKAGQGGGIVGAFMVWGLFQGFGVAGGTVMLAAGWLIAILVTIGRSLPEIITLVMRRLPRLRLPDAWRPWPAPDKDRSVVLGQAAAAKAAPAAPIEAHQPPTPGTAPAAAKAAAAAAPGGTETALMIGVDFKWQLPALADILEQGTEGATDDEFDRKRVQVIESTLASFGAPVKIVEVNRGPTITQFGVEPDFLEQRGGKRTKVKVGKIAALADDLALALSAQSIRIEAPVPGKGYVGIEVPNSQTSVVALRDVMESERFDKLKSPLRLGLGQDVSGSSICADLTQMPHLLIAGTTGSGKSVCVNAIIGCLILKNTPDDLRLLMVDPKRVELTGYNGIPHLLAPVVVDLERVVASLQWVSREMDERYRKFAKLGVRNIADYNARAILGADKKLPYLVVIIDELADLMMLAPDETERTLTRLAQLARATGIHLVIATQRPSVDVVTGLIKANFPARIAFAVASSIDSRVILDQPGAERLLGRGDMLFQSPDSAQPLRMQGVYVSDHELQNAVRYWKEQRLAAIGPAAAAEEAAAGAPAETGAPASANAARQPAQGVILKQSPLWEEMSANMDGKENDDDLLEEAIKAVREMKKASISMLQRRLRIGYTRAARLIDALEEKGIIGPAESGAKPREVINFGTREAPQAEEEKNEEEADDE